MVSPTNGFWSCIYVLAFPPVSILWREIPTEFNLIAVVGRREGSSRLLGRVFCFSFLFWGDPVSFIRCSVLSSLWLRWRWSGNQWVTRFSLSFWKSELFSSQCCCRFRQRILANLDPSRGLLIGSRELLWKLCPIEMRLLPRWYHLLFSSYKLFINDFFFSLFLPVQLTPQ